MAKKSRPGAWLTAAWLILLGWVFLHRASGPRLAQPLTLYVVAYSHLDSQWNTDYPTTIRKYLKKTMLANFALLEKYPHYLFNFSGAYRYRLMKEYFPEEYARLKRHVAAGRWFPAGSSMEECEVNLPSAESIIRQILYGSRYFLAEFGKSSAEFMLPDGFGFPASLPSILAHCGLKGFSTQKLTFGSYAPVGGENSLEKTPRGIPFNVGVWEGPDGSGVIAALDPGKYRTPVWYDLSRSPDTGAAGAGLPRIVDWPRRVQRNGIAGGLYADYMYYGTGDTGGAPDASGVRLMEAIVTKSETQLPPPPKKRGVPRAAARNEKVRAGMGPLRVIPATAEQMFLDIKPEQRLRLPRFRGELELTSQSTGTLTSQGYIKRWNRRNEVLADAAEKAAVAAEWLGGPEYPRQRLNDAWTLVTAAQFHDVLAGTAIARANEYTWNDQLLAMNLFTGVLSGAAGTVAAAMDTRTRGVPVLVYNALEIEREDVVEAAVNFPDGMPRAVRVFSPEGREVPAQLTAAGKVLFLARVPPAGFAVFDVRAVASPSAAVPASASLRASPDSLENDRYRIRLDKNGDAASIYDKALSRELLSAPAHLEIRTDDPEKWPAWNIDWEDQSRPPRSRVRGPARIRIIENGPARIALEIDRQGEGSRFVQTVRLAAGAAGERVEFANAIDWRTGRALLKAVFPLTAAAARATYNLGVGTIERQGNDKKKFEVLSHQWFDQTDGSGSFGVSVLSDCKYGSDKPDDRSLRLTLLRTPGTRGGHREQGTQDFGHHEFIYGLAAHAGDWRRGQTDWQAYRLNQPLVPFQAARHDGALGKSFSFLHLSHDRVRVLALKKAEASAEYIIRLVEMNGSGAAGVRVRFAAPILAAREVSGREMPIGGALVENGELVVDFKPYQPRSFAFTIAGPSRKVQHTQGEPVPLPYQVQVTGKDGERTAKGFDSVGRTIPTEMLPGEVIYQGMRFKLADGKNGPANAVACRGQEVELPSGRFSRLLLLAAADGDQRASFRTGDRVFDLLIQDWGGFIGQWDNRIWQAEASPATAPGEKTRKNQPALICTGLKPGFIKPAAVAWFASHRHTAEGANDPYAYAYLFAYELGLPARAKSLRLPNNPRIRILAITAVDKDWALQPLRPIGEDLQVRAP